MLKNKIFAAIAAVLVIALAVTGVLVGLPKLATDNTVQASADDKDDSKDDKTKDQAKFQIDLNGNELDRYLAQLKLTAKTVEFREASLRQHNKDRTFSAKVAKLIEKAISDATEYVFDNSAAAISDPSDENIQKIVDELKLTIISNPVIGDMMARGIVDIKIGNKTLGELNPWLVEFISLNDTYYAEDPNSPPAGLEHWLNQEAEDKPIYMTREYLRYAVGLCMIIDQMDKHIGSLKSTTNYHLTGMQLPNMTRTELSNYQEDKPALILDYVGKDGVRMFRFGFNLLDRRFELFDTTSEVAKVKKQDTPKPTPTPDKPKPTPDKPKPTPDKPKPTPDKPTPTPDKPTPTPKPKDPSKDPVNNGNADRGGGKNLPTDGAGDYQPKKPEKSSSTKVEESQYQPPKPQVKPEDTKKDYEEKTGNTVVNVDNGTPPPTPEIPVIQDSHDDQSGKPGQDAGVENGEFAMPD